MKRFHLSLLSLAFALIGSIESFATDKKEIFDQKNGVENKATRNIPTHETENPLLALSIEMRCTKHGLAVHRSVKASSPEGFTFKDVKDEIDEIGLQEGLIRLLNHPFPIAQIRVTTEAWNQEDLQEDLGISLKKASKIMQYVSTHTEQVLENNEYVTAACEDISKRIHVLNKDYLLQMRQLFAKLQASYKILDVKFTSKALELLDSAYERFGIKTQSPSNLALCTALINVRWQEKLLQAKCYSTQNWRRVVNKSVKYLSGIDSNVVEEVKLKIDDIFEQFQEEMKGATLHSAKIFYDIQETAFTTYKQLEAESDEAQSTPLNKALRKILCEDAE